MRANACIRGITNTVSNAHLPSYQRTVLKIHSKPIVILALFLCASAETSLHPLYAKESAEQDRTVQPNTKQKFDDYFVFVDSLPPNTAQNPDAPVLKQWDTFEKAQVQMIFAGVLVKQPGLVKLAAAGGKIELTRTSRHSMKNEVSTQSVLLAMAGPEGIVFTDWCFSAPNKLLHIVHELVHLADRSRTLAYSKEFVEFAHWPTVAAMQKSRAPGLKMFSQTEWPRPVNAYNMSEVFADYVAIDYCYGEVPHVPEVDKLLQTRLYHPGEKQLMMEKLFKEVSIAYEKRNWLEALNKTKECLKLEPDAVYPMITLLRCKMMLKEDLPGCLKLCEKIQAQFDQYGLDSEDSRCREFMYVKASAFAKANKLDMSKKVCDAILRGKPRDFYALSLRSAVFEKQELYADSIRDLRTITGRNMPPINAQSRNSLMTAASHFASSDWSACIEYCDKALQADSNAVDAVIFKCRCFQMQGNVPLARETYFKAKSMLLPRREKSSENPSILPSPVIK